MDATDLTLIDDRFAWIIAVFGAIFLISQMVKKTGNEVDDMFNGFRRSSSTRKKSRLSEMKSDLDYVIEEVAQLKEGIRLRDRLAETHSRWDHQLIMTALRLDPTIEISDPPPLVPTAEEDPIKEGRKDASA